MNKRILVTGSAGFIGFHLSKRLLEEGNIVIGIDNMNDYYDVNLKKARLAELKKKDLSSSFIFYQEDIQNKEALDKIFCEHEPEVVINLAAQAGVRYSIENPRAYIDSNLIGFYNVLECCKDHSVKHLIYASSSSVYGANKEAPFKESDYVDHPLSLYAATKKANELLAYSYSHLFNIPSTGLRFFTVYGPMGRPDMAYYKFTDKFFDNEEIVIFNGGDIENDLYRDFTYIDDIVEGIVNLIPKVPAEDHNKTKHEVFNIGNNTPVRLMDFIGELERALSKSLSEEIKFKKRFEDLKPGDVPLTYASTKKLEDSVGFKPNTPLEHGLKEFTDWYVEYYKILKDKERE